MQRMFGLCWQEKGAVLFTLNSIFRTIQGEGDLLGVPMTFIRTAGCSVGCPLCDTDYSRKQSLPIESIVDTVRSLQTNGWVWLTGGEPTDQKTSIELLRAVLQAEGYKVAIATAGVKPLSNQWDFISVSPHTKDFVQRTGHQLNVVPRLNGFSLDDLTKLDVSGFDSKYVTPCDGDLSTIDECADFVLGNPTWKLGVQAHKVWGQP